MTTANDRAPELDRVLALARDRDRDRVQALSHDLARARELAHALAQGRDRALARALVRELARTYGRARELDLDLDFDLDLALDRARYLARAGTRARAYAINLAQDLDRAYLSTQGLERHLAALDTVMEEATENHAPVWLPAAGFSVRATAWVARLLPTKDQPHYRELYRSELAELAQGSHPRGAQFAYTIRVLLHVLPLRRTLRAPAPAARQRTW